MSRRLHLVKDVLDLSVGTNDERHPRNPFEDSSVHALVFDHAESVTDFLIDIGQQGIGKVVLLLKLLLFGDRVG